MGKTLIIGLGHEAKQGKDTLANHLIETIGGAELPPDGKWRKQFPLHIKRYAFADALKVEVFDYIQGFAFLEKQGGETMNQNAPDTNRLYTYEEKLEYINQHKEALRSILQIWGTEFRRNQSLQYWVNQTLSKIKEDAPQVAIISDMRFPNEAGVCDVTVNVVREGFEDLKAKGHVSEQSLSDFPYNHKIVAFSVESLKGQGEVVFEGILKENGLLPR